MAYDVSFTHSAQAFLWRTASAVVHVRKGQDKLVIVLLSHEKGPALGKENNIISRDKLS